MEIIIDKSTVLHELGWSNGARMRSYGESGPCVILLHGGPAATGGEGMETIGQCMSSSFRVIEPWQRGSCDEPLTVARHIEDLHYLVQQQKEDENPILMGASWGAMLALAYAAEHPESVGPIVLVGCGTFDPPSFAELKRRLAERKEKEYPLYSREDIKIEENMEEPFDWDAHNQTWQDMVRLRCMNVYPAAFSSIKSPILMLHGGYDPHPGSMIRDNLREFIPQLEYHEWPNGGHSLFMEAFIQKDFFTVLIRWLYRHSNVITEKR